MYTYQEILQDSEGKTHYRIADENDDRIGTCYDEDNAKLIVANLNRRSNNPLTVGELCVLAHQTAKSKGFYDHPKPIPESLALMHSELSEALEEYRRCKNDQELVAVVHNGRGEITGFAVELADCVIRIADTCGSLGIDLEEVVLKKMEYNKSRPYKHGKRC